MAAAMKDLSEFVEKPGMYCLGSCVGQAPQNALNDDRSMVLTSDADEQLLLHIPFSGAVKICGLKILGLGDGACDRRLPNSFNPAPIACVVYGHASRRARAPAAGGGTLGGGGGCDWAPLIVASSSDGTYLTPLPPSRPPFRLIAHHSEAVRE